MRIIINQIPLKMKKFVKILGVLVVVMALTSCSKDDGSIKNQPIAQKVISKPGALQELAVDLVVGQHTVIGQVTVWHDASQFFVSIDVTEPDWYFTNAKMHLGDVIPLNSNGSPQIGHFANNVSFDPAATNHDFVFDILGGTKIDLGSCFKVAVHVDAIKVDALGNTIQTETGWARGTKFATSTWAMYIEQFCIDERLPL
jgi:hypothetical protein